LPLFLAAALCAREAKLPFDTLPPPAFADALWMREAALDVILLPPPLPPLPKLITSFLLSLM